MNRREFIKGSLMAALSSALLPLVPRLVRPVRILEPARIEVENYWCVLERVLYEVENCEDGSRHSFTMLTRKADQDQIRIEYGLKIVRTALLYRGSNGGIVALSECILQACRDDLRFISHKPRVEELKDDWGEVQSIVYCDEAELLVNLNGLWWTEIGCVQKGKTNARKL